MTYDTVRFSVNDLAASLNKLSPYIGEDKGYGIRRAEISMNLNPGDCGNCISVVISDESFSDSVLELTNELGIDPGQLVVRVSSGATAYTEEPSGEHWWSYYPE